MSVSYLSDANILVPICRQFPWRTVLRTFSRLCSKIHTIITTNDQCRLGVIAQMQVELKPYLKDTDPLLQNSQNLTLNVFKVLFCKLKALKRGAKKGFSLIPISRKIPSNIDFNYYHYCGDSKIAVCTSSETGEIGIWNFDTPPLKWTQLTTEATVSMQTQCLQLVVDAANSDWLLVLTATNHVAIQLRLFTVFKCSISNPEYKHIVIWERPETMYQGSQLRRIWQDGFYISSLSELNLIVVSWQEGPEIIQSQDVLSLECALPSRNALIPNKPIRSCYNIITLFDNGRVKRSHYYKMKDVRSLFNTIWYRPPSFTGDTTGFLNFLMLNNYSELNVVGYNFHKASTNQIDREVNEVLYTERYSVVNRIMFMNQEIVDNPCFLFHHGSKKVTLLEHRKDHSSRRVIARTIELSLETTPSFEQYVGYGKKFISVLFNDGKITVFKINRRNYSMPLEIFFRIDHIANPRIPTILINRSWLDGINFNKQRLFLGIGLPNTIETANGACYFVNCNTLSSYPFNV